MREDIARLRAVLHKEHVADKLADVGQVAQDSSLPYRGHEQYEPLCKPFCDGLKIRVGRSFDRMKPWWLKDLEVQLNGFVPGLIVRHIMVTGSHDKTSLWITLTPETAGLTSRTVLQLHQALATVRRCARAKWRFEDQAVELIELTKVDVTMDFKGSLLPVDHRDAYTAIKALLKPVLGEIFRDSATNFLSPVALNGLRLKRGDNILASCFQYAVHDGDDLKLLQVKIYDKIMDLVGRDGAAIVGSKIAQIIGCQGTLSSFQKRVSQARYGGMTRLEISLCPGAMTKYRPFQPSLKTCWVQKVGAAFERLHRFVLNDERVLELAYRRLNIGHFLGELGQCKVQVLAIGHQASWLVSHKTAHKQHFVGTLLRHKDGCGGQLSLKARKIETFVKRFAAHVSPIHIYDLTADGFFTEKVAKLCKKGSPRHQLPGCRDRGKNGITLPEHLQAPIPAAEMGKIWLKRWNFVALCINNPASGCPCEAMDAETTAATE